MKDSLLARLLARLLADALVKVLALLLADMLVLLRVETRGGPRASWCWTDAATSISGRRIVFGDKLWSSPQSGPLLSKRILRFRNKTVPYGTSSGSGNSLKTQNSVGSRSLERKFWKYRA